MPNKEMEFVWAVGVIKGTIERETGAVNILVKNAAAAIYHQFHIHGSENPLSATAMLKKVVETFFHLTPQEMKALRDAHKKMPSHYY